MMVTLLLVLALVSTGHSEPQFPKRFTAGIQAESSWGENLGCAGLPMVTKVYQDTHSTLWSHHIASDGVHAQNKETLYTVPSSTADPDTPEATQLTQFSWNSDTTFEDCDYMIWYDNIGRVLPEFFPYSTPYLEIKERIDGIECEKWSNKAGLYDYYWAVWYPINTQPPYSKVQRAQYIFPPSRPGQFPTPGCSINYTFTDFSTDPIPPSTFNPPDEWLTKCTDRDQGLKKYKLPNRQDGYVCVKPGMKNAFEISLQTKPVRGNAIVQIQPCTHDDSCIDGARCKDCVLFNTNQLVFTPENWSTPQTIEVKYDKADGDSQFVFRSPNYYLNNTFYTQFSTCACASGKCSNSCQKYCGPRN